MPLLMPIFTEVYRYYQRLKSVFIGAVVAGFELQFDFPDPRQPYEIDMIDSRQFLEFSMTNPRQFYELDMTQQSEA